MMKFQDIRQDVKNTTSSLDGENNQRNQNGYKNIISSNFGLENK